MRPLIILKHWVCLAIMSHLIIGCGTIKLPEYHASAGSFFDGARTREYFGIDAASSGIAILYLQVENQNPEITFLLLKENMRFFLGTTADANQTQRQDVSWDSHGDSLMGAGYALVITGPLLASIPLILAGAKMFSDSTAIQHSFTSRELGNRTLSPGQKAQGFVYFQIEKGQPLKEGTLTITLVDTANQKPNKFEIHVP